MAHDVSLAPATLPLDESRDIADAVEIVDVGFVSFDLDFVFLFEKADQPQRRQRIQDSRRTERRIVGQIVR